MKYAVIVTCFENYSYHVRMKYVEKYLKSRGYDCIVLSADFDHRNKKPYTVTRENLELLHVPAYKKNLSFSRIYSHYIFAKRVFERSKQIQPQLIYGSVPPNFLIAHLSKFKRTYKDTKLIYEIGDLWPETLPISKKWKALASPVLRAWAYLRNANIKEADGVIYECELFKKRISKFHPDVFSNTIYFCKKDFFHGKFKMAEEKGVLNFAYIGSVNYIIDMELIVLFLTEMKKRKKVRLILIGTGENRGKLHELCKKNEIDFQDYGVIYDDERKYEILKECQFAFNIMKSSVVVGVTMKSIDYFHWGLCLINNIPADTEGIVNKYKCGLNMGYHSYKEVAHRIGDMRYGEIEKMRRNARNVYEKFFDEKIIRKKYERFLDRVEGR